MAPHETASEAGLAVDLAIVAGRATITVEEAASLLGIGRSAAYEAARRGQLPTRRLGRRLCVPVPALLDWLGVALTHDAGQEAVSIADRHPVSPR